jgi:hypothetical protein
MSVTTDRQAGGGHGAACSDCMATESSAALMQCSLGWARPAPSQLNAGRHSAAVAASACLDSVTRFGVQMIHLN